MIKTDVLCPSCGESLCNFCAFNRLCQECMTELPAKTVRAVKVEVENILSPTG